MKIGFWGFQFLRIEFQWHFCKIKQRMGLTRMTCPIKKRLSPKISLPFSLQPILLSVSSPSSFFFLYPGLALLTDPSLLLHKPPPPHQSSPLRATTRSGLRSLSLSHPFCQIVTIMSNHHEPLQAQPRLGLCFSFFFSLSLFPPFADRFLSQSFFLSIIPFARSVHLYV